MGAVSGRDWTGWNEVVSMQAQGSGTKVWVERVGERREVRGVWCEIVAALAHWFGGAIEAVQPPHMPVAF